MVNLFESLNVRPTKKAMLLVFQLLFSFFFRGGEGTCKEVRYLNIFERPGDHQINTRHIYPNELAVVH